MSFITRVDTRLKDLEDLACKTISCEIGHARYRLQVVSLSNLDSEEQLREEQEALDQHNDHIAEMNHRLHRSCSLATPTSSSELIDRKMNHLLGRGSSTNAMIDSLATDKEEHLDPSLLEQTEIQLLDYKTLLAAIHSELLLVKNQESIHDLLEQHSDTETTLFQCSHKTRKLLKTCRSLSSVIPSCHTFAHRHHLAQVSNSQK